MKKAITIVMAAGIIFPALVSSTAHAARKEIILARPDLKTGVPLMTALSRRKSSRSFSERPLTEKALSGLLWAANGINRDDEGKRTAPTAVNKQEIDVYAVMAEGVYRYDPRKNSLQLVVAQDLRSLTGKQNFVGKAPLNLVYVADMSRAAGAGKEDKLLYAAADTGFIGQNVYLFCASEGLATVIRAYLDKEALAKAMGLGPEQMIVLAQTVGYPGK